MYNSETSRPFAIRNFIRRIIVVGYCLNKVSMQSSRRTMVFMATDSSHSDIIAKTVFIIVANDENHDQLEFRSYPITDC